ncbi:hypothetical protein AAFF_G00382140 [Aldrovandia affinis]|uniref:Uncharacterized protein n=1 Tax=Aldrovandia affinis TaxID=143900 RepID=A0AAD7T8E9_9TELE|nr:hypothetical protein AAFF_G00382140 [Aldrovandia affinis]
MVATEAKYHTKCLVRLYNRERKANLEGINDNGKGQAASASDIVFAELVLYIDETRQDEETASVFKLAELAQLYNSRMEQLGVEVDGRVHTTRLKERLLAEFPDMRSYSKGREVLMAFEVDVSTALAKACADRSLPVLIGPVAGCSKTIDRLPEYYTEVPPVSSNIKVSQVPETRIKSLTRDGFSWHNKEEYKWLDNAREVVENKTTADDHAMNTSWAAFHASRQPPGIRVTSSTALLPLFQESAHTVAMIKHSLDVVSKAVEHLNPGQSPVVTFDQPLYALAKQIQFKWPEKYGEDKLVVMFGGLHIEMAVLKMLGNWLQGSGWVEALVQADISSPGTADSFLKAAHVSRTRRAHQITAAALNVLQHRAYDNYCQTQTDGVPLVFEAWCSQRAENIPQFQYWSIVLELELLMLVFVRSLREASFTMYLDTLTELAKWFHAMDHTHYARWIPVHLRDMAELPRAHPRIDHELFGLSFLS